jgi:RimJ/RimL family protein N-acetyltransferase
LAWGKAHFGANTAFVCLIDPDNAPSIGVAQKHGYREFARTTYRGGPSILFRRQPS